MTEKVVYVRSNRERPHTVRHFAPRQSNGDLPPALSNHSSLTRYSDSSSHRIVLLAFGNGHGEFGCDLFCPIEFPVRAGFFEVALTVVFEYSPDFERSFGGAAANRIAVNRDVIAEGF